MAGDLNVGGASESQLLSQHDAQKSPETGLPKLLFVYLKFSKIASAGWKKKKQSYTANCMGERSIQVCMCLHGLLKFPTSERWNIEWCVLLLYDRALGL